MKCIYYKSKSFNAYENLAVEEYLFDNLRQGFFVFYLWQNKHTVVIGRNQNAYLECKVDKFLQNNGTLARRMTGGGAVYHDLSNLNFTFIFNKDDYNVEKNFSAIVLALKQFGINAQTSGRNDMTVCGKKISGNAFLNSANKVCHHGTLLVDVDIENMTKYLNVDRGKLLKNGVHSVKSRVANLTQFNNDLTIDDIEKSLLLAVQKVFSPTEVIHAEIADCTDKINKFSSHSHIFGANARFESKVAGRFDWGKVDIDFTVQSAMITNIEICTDSLAVDEIATVKGQLSNCKISEIRQRVAKNTISNDIITLIERSL